MRPYLKIALVVLIIVVAGLVIYFIWSALTGSAPEPTPGISNPTLPIERGGAGTGGSEEQPPISGTSTAALAKISENPVFDFWIDPGTKEIYYVTPDGIVFSAKNGGDLQITRGRLGALNFIKISPNGQRVLAAFGDPRLPQWGIFDAIDGAWHPLPDGIIGAAWGGDSDTIIGFVKNGNGIGLSSINVSKNPPAYKVLAKDLRLQNVSLDFVPPNNLILAEPPASNYPSRIWDLNLKDASVHQIFSPENGLVIKVSSDGKIVLVFSRSGGFRVLGWDALNTVLPVPFETLPSKCSPDSAVIYCFVPTGDEFGNASLPDDYLKRKIYTADALFKMSVASDEVLPMPIPRSPYGPIDAKNPLSSGGKIYFINRYDNSLYSLTPGGE